MTGTLSSTANNPSLNGQGFLDLLAKDGIALGSTNKYGNALVQTQQNNFAPRFGFAYQATPKLVVRGGVGLFFNAFENQGYGPNIGENYPFVYNFDFKANGSDTAPFSSGPNPYGTCGTAGVGGGAPIGAGLTCAAFTPLAVNAAGLSLQGLQFNYQTPRTFSTNLTLQYALTNTLSAQAAYVFTDGSDLQHGIGNNRGFSTSAGQHQHNSLCAISRISLRARSYQRTIGSSIYNGLQTKLEQQLSNGLNYLFTYTYSKTFSDAGDLLNGGQHERIPRTLCPGLGPRFDWGLADFDIRNVFHISGSYELPLAKTRSTWLTSESSQTTWSADGASTGSRPSRVASPFLSVAQRQQPLGQTAMT